jgi:hypothetical protein
MIGDHEGAKQLDQMANNLMKPDENDPGNKA